MLLNNSKPQEEVAGPSEIRGLECLVAPASSETVTQLGDRVPDLTFQDMATEDRSTYGKGLYQPITLSAIGYALWKPQIRCLTEGGWK